MPTKKKKLPAARTSVKKTPVLRAVPPKKKALPASQKSTTVKKGIVKTETKKSPVTPRTPAVAALRTGSTRTSWASTLSNVAMHLVIVGSAIGVLVLLGIAGNRTFSTGKSNAAESAPVTIGFEHTGPLTVGTLFGKKAHAGYLSLTNQSEETIHVALPASWRRQEVTGASIDAFTSDPPSAGFIRWAMPARSGMTMLLPEAPDSVLFYNFSDYTTAVELSMVDLDSGTKSNAVVLVQKQTLAPLWTSEE